MEIIGMWWNPLKKGEGFIFAKDTDPETGEIVIIGYYYTYSGVAPVWYILYELKQVGLSLIGDVGVTRAESMSEPGNPGKVTETRVGSCKLTPRTDNTYDIEINIGAGRISYRIGSLFGTGLPPWNPQPEPGPVDPPPPPQVPDNPFLGKLTFRVRPFNHPSWLDGSFMLNSQEDQWFAIWSTPQIRWTSLRPGENTMFQMEITALEDFDFLNTSGASGFGSPFITGIPSRLRAGEHCDIAFKLMRDARPSGHANAHYQINTSLGTLVVLTERILGGQ